MTTPLTLLAAGSLKCAFMPLLAQFQQQSGIPVVAYFGPAGLLRERIEAGERCSLFASACTRHPQALRQAGLAGECRVFTRNQLILTARRTPENEKREWLELLADPLLRLGTSTPGCDPCGDYTWQLFERIEASHPGLGNALKARARPLVGGRDSLIVPADKTAGAWLIGEDLADLFIGYAHYQVQARLSDRVRIVAIAQPWNICCNYQLAQIENRSEVRQLCRFILGTQGQAHLRAAGFMPLNAEL